MDDPELCPTAPLFRLGIYLLNDLGCLFGLPEEIQVMTSRLRTGRPTADNAQMMVRYPNRALGHIAASFCIDDGDRYQNSLSLHFENGTIYRNVGGLRLHEPRGEGAELCLVQRGTKGRQVIEATRVEEMSGSYQWGALADAIEAGRGIDAAYAVRLVDSVRILDALRRSQHAGAGVIRL